MYKLEFVYMLQEEDVWRKRVKTRWWRWGRAQSSSEDEL